MMMLLIGLGVPLAILLLVCIIEYGWLERLERQLERKDTVTIKAGPPVRTVAYLHDDICREVFDSADVSQTGGGGGR